MNCTITIKRGRFRLILVHIFLYLIRQLEIEKIRQKYTDENFQKSEPWPLREEHSNCSESVKKVKEEWFKLCQKFSELESLPFDSMISSLTQAGSFPSLYTTYEEILNFFENAGLSIIENEDKSDTLMSVNSTKKESELVVTSIEQLTLKDGSKPQSLNKAVMRVHELLRSEKRLPTKEEFLAIQAAKFLVEKGSNIDYPYQDWGTSGFRKTQTWMSITDPGEGHIYGTATKSEYLSGIITHIEHLERCNEDRLKIESYRIPQIKDVATVRLFIASDAPISSYIGRPIFESGFKAGLLKTVNTVAAAVSQMFALGLTECKIAIEGMTATQAVLFMQCIAGAVKRDKHRQILSAAFNINTKMFDDRHHPHWVKDRFEIALLGIEITQAGGFDKVTFDGSGDAYPSRCLLHQLSHSEAVELVHKAHEKGLLTYFSAGFRYHHLPLAVYTGVDGVGVGGAQILRYMDKNTGYHGPFKADNISEILKIRDEAANNWQGKAAALLSRLDRMIYEGSLTVNENSLRLELFEAVKAQNKTTCEQLLNQLSSIAQLPADTQHPLMEWGTRIILSGERSLMAQGKTREEWTSFIWSIKQAIQEKDLDLLADQLTMAKSVTPPLYPVSYQQMEAA